MSKKAYIPENIAVVGPYSPAVEAGGFVYLSGQIPIDASTGKIVEGDISAQAEQCFKNMTNLLASADLTTDNVVKATVFLTDMGDFKAVNEVYSKYFNEPYPARTAIAVAALPLGVGIEIEAIAKR